MSAEIHIATLADRSAWDQIQAISSVPSHGWSFASALVPTGIEPRLALLRDGQSTLVMPFFERQWKGTIDICTLQSVSGACVTGAAPRLLSAWREHARCCGWIAGFIQVRPGDDLAGVAEASDGNAVFMLDLGGADLLAGASTIIRRKVRRNDVQGLTVTFDRVSLARDLCEIYPDAMRRTGATAAYRLPPESLRRIAQSPDHLVLGAVRDGTLLGVMVFLVCGERAEYHINASIAKGRDASAWLIWQALRALKERGVRQLNLGGGAKPGDGLYDFKAKFGGTAMSLRYVKQIYDAEAYDRLCREEETSSEESWFPAYRARHGRLPFV
jgi:hypothetical protein